MALIQTCTPRSVDHLWLTETISGQTYVTSQEECEAVIRYNTIPRKFTTDLFGNLW